MEEAEGNLEKAIRVEILSMVVNECYKQAVNCQNNMRKYKEVKHAYEEKYFGDIKYLSDSQGWYEGCICKVFSGRKYDRVQLLLHPYLWQDSLGDFIDNIERVIGFRNKELIDYFLRYHPVYRRSRGPEGNQ